MTAATFADRMNVMRTNEDDKLFYPRSSAFVRVQSITATIGEPTDA